MSITKQDCNCFRHEHEVFATGKCIICTRLDEQDKVIKALAETVKALHEYNRVRDSRR